MSGILPSFLSSSQLVIKIGNTQIAMANAISFNDNMTLSPVGGIGNYQALALEPVQYAASGSMSITHYSQQAFAAANPGKLLPNALQSTTIPGDDSATHNGNSLLNKEFMHPLLLMISRSFDVDIYFKNLQGDTAATLGIATPLAGGLVYTLKDCRISGYSTGFVPGSLVQENIGFLCIRVIDHTSQGAAKASVQGA